MESKNKQVIVDFVIPSLVNPLIVIEAKQHKAIKRDNLYDILKTYSIDIDHKLSGIKRRWPDIKTIGIMSSVSFPLESISSYLTAEFFDTDYIFIDKTLALIPECINSILKRRTTTFKKG